MFKKHKILWLYSACALTFALSMIAGFLYQVNNPQSDAALPTEEVRGAFATEAKIAVEKKEPSYYLIGEKEGYVALFVVYENGDKELLEITDTSILSLRGADMRLVREGIALPTLNDAQIKIEDFVG